MNFLNQLKAAPPDSLFGIQNAFDNDPRKNKVNLSIGTYKTEKLEPLILSSVKEAEKFLIETEVSKDYLPIEGYPPYIDKIKQLIFGDAIDEVFGVQAVGGTGALRLAAYFLRKAGFTKVYLSDPTWGNHARIFEQAGLLVESYPYFEWEKPFSRMEKNSLVLLQACCHNPTGTDPAKEQLEEIGKIMKARALFPIFDFAYQGFGEGIEEDAWGVRFFMRLGIPFMVAASQSKNFGLYRERVGSLFLRSLSKSDVSRLLSQMKVAIRGLYSNPPAHGALIVAHILASQHLSALWQSELREMRQRILDMRHLLVEKLPFLNFISEQKGMFSFTHLKENEVERLQEEFGIYMLKNGRINVAGLNSKNVGYVSEAILAVHAKKEL